MSVYKYVYVEIDRQTEADRQAGMQAGRQAGRQAYTQTKACGGLWGKKDRMSIESH